MKRVLITGANSYIGTSVEKWLKKYPDKYSVDTIDVKNNFWKEKSFSTYDVVYHVAGIAHADVGKVSDETKKLYYTVNRDLAIEIAKKAERDGVRQFIFMSSMIIYGESGGFREKRIITKDTKPRPANFYGDSKWQADEGIQRLGNNNFKVVIVRPPMIYGKGSKGNYPMLAKIAKKSPIFPEVKNQRSMLYIDNLCEFIRLVIENEDFGIFFPQNAEYNCTSTIIKEIAKNYRKNIIVTPLLAPFVALAALFPGKIGGLVNKAFGNFCYEKNMSVYKNNYQLVSFEESIEFTEK